MNIFDDDKFGSVWKFMIKLLEKQKKVLAKKNAAPPAHRVDESNADYTGDNGDENYEDTEDDDNEDNEDIEGEQD